ncbi:MAG TPA: AzlD domain-containing protein [Candidatus Dormibacteraeota bacterium]|nr:AzlD domain-containing protein [Candidatus Dormibacteraeota bacterium]
MSGWQLAALVAAVATGVLLPKALPAALMGGPVGRRTERFLNLLPAALLGGLVAINALGGGSVAGLHPRLPVLAAVVVAGALAAVTRRSLLSMAGGWAALAVALAIS